MWRLIEGGVYLKDQNRRKLNHVNLVKFLIKAALEHLRMRCLLGGGVYFTFPFPNAAFIGGRGL